MPAIAHIQPLATLLGIAFAAVAPLLPRRAPASLNFGEPMVFQGRPANEAHLTETVQQGKPEFRSRLALALRDLTRNT